MSQLHQSIRDTQKECWTEDNLKEAMRRITAGEISMNEVETLYGIPPRTVYRQRAKENIKAQLNTGKPVKLDMPASSGTRKPDYTILTQPVGIGCSDLSGALKMLMSGTEEVKHILQKECAIIYECKVCKALFRSIVNFISHKRLHCQLYTTSCQMDSDDEQSKNCEDKSVENNLKTRQYIREQVSRPNRITCRTDLTAIMQKMMELPHINMEPLLKLQRIDSNQQAFYQTLISNIPIKNETNTPPIIQKTDTVPSDNKRNTSPKEKKSVKTNNDVNNKKTEDNKSTAIEVPLLPAYCCPCCKAHYSLRQSVIRHLKLAHRKTSDQILRLKSKIQTKPIRADLFVKRDKILKKIINVKNNGKSTKSKPKPIISVNSERRHVCPSCKKIFSYKRSLRVHMNRSCRKKAAEHSYDVAQSEKQDEQTNEEQNIILPVINVASQTPQFSENNSKKIGIQVRMNYCKESKNNSSNSFDKVADIRKNEQSNKITDAFQSCFESKNTSENDAKSDNSIVASPINRSNHDGQIKPLKAEVNPNSTIIDIHNIENISIKEENATLKCTSVQSNFYNINSSKDTENDENVVDLVAIKPPPKSKNLQKIELKPKKSLKIINKNITIPKPKQNNESTSKLKTDTKVKKKGLQTDSKKNLETNKVLKANSELKKNEKLKVKPKSIIKSSSKIEKLSSSPSGKIVEQKRIIRGKVESHAKVEDAINSFKKAVELSMCSTEPNTVSSSKRCKSNSVLDLNKTRALCESIKTNILREQRSNSNKEKCLNVSPTDGCKVTEIQNGIITNRLLVNGEVGGNLDFKEDNQCLPELLIKHRLQSIEFDPSLSSSTGR